MTLFEQTVNSSPMQSLRDSLPEGFLAQMQKELGPEETLRLLWPLVVGANLGASTRLRGIRRNTLRVSVPDQAWKRTLGSMEQIILDAVHRMCGKEVGRAIEFVEDPSLANPSPRKQEFAIQGSPVELPLDEIPDPELRRTFRQSAQKYFAHREKADQ